MICVECAEPVDFLYTYYAEDNIHATKCTKCGDFADKYIECDTVLVVIDLLLLRKAAVRHVVFNTTEKHAMEVAPGSHPPSRSATPLLPDDHSKSSTKCSANTSSLETVKGNGYSFFSTLSPTVFRLLLFVTMFDVYLQWAMSERSTVPSVLHFLLDTHPALQYALFMTLCIADTVLVHFIVRNLASYLIGWTDGAAVSTSLLIGSFFKLLPVLTLIWHYDIPFVEQLVQYVSLACSTEILSITLGCGYVYAGLLTLAGRIASVLLYRLFWSLV